MCSPLGPVIANIFMVELENTLVPKLENYVKKWRRFVDDKFQYVKIEYVLSVLNSFHNNGKFTYMKKDKTILYLLEMAKPFIPVFIGKIRIMILHIYWNSFTLISWKRGTMKSLIGRAYIVCLNETY